MSCRAPQITKTAPRLHRLRATLRECAYNGDVDAGGWHHSEPATTLPPPTVGVTWDELVDSVQCSEAQLRAGLVAEGAFQITPTRWAVLDEGYADTLLAELNVAIDALNLDLDRRPLPTEALTSELAPRHAGFAVEAALQLVCTPNTWKFDFTRAAARAAGAALRKLLSAAGVAPTASGTRGVSATAWCDHPVRADAFLAAWASALPASVVRESRWDAPAADEAGVLSAARARAVCIVDHVPGAPPSVRYLHLPALPHTAAARFAALFSVRARWAVAELRPFIEALIEPGRTLDDLLLTHCRAVPAPDGSTLFCAR